MPLRELLSGWFLPGLKSRPLGKLEADVMEQVWARGELSVRELHLQYAPQLAYTTLMTTLDRLYKKGLLERRKQGRAFYYVARLSRVEFEQKMARELVVGLLNSASGSAVLSTFVNAVSDRDRELLDKLEELVKTRRRELRRSE